MINIMKNNKALVILSGGQDSTTSLGWALKNFDAVEALTFDYGQRHRRELDCAIKVAELFKVKHRIVTIDSFSQLTSNAMMSEKLIETNQESGLPSTFVPGRNLIFVTFAAAYAYERKIANLVLGVSMVDYSGYPDCREETMKSLEKTISLGMDFSFKLHTPLIHLDKKQTVLLAKELGILDTLKYTHTCYIGANPPCGSCPACILRAKGFSGAGVKDPLLN